MKGSLREVIGNYLILNSHPPPLSPIFLSLYIFEETYFRLFQWAIKFECQFLAIFQSFFLIDEFYVQQISPPLIPKYTFQNLR